MAISITFGLIVLPEQVLRFIYLSFQNLKLQLALLNELSPQW